MQFRTKWTITGLYRSWYGNCCNKNKNNDYVVKSGLCYE